MIGAGKISGPIAGIDDRSESCTDVRSRKYINYEVNLIKKDLTKADRIALKNNGFDQIFSCERCVHVDLLRGKKYLKPLEEYKTLHFVKYAFLGSVNRSLHTKENVHIFDYKCSVCNAGKSFSFREEELKTDFKMPDEEFTPENFTKIEMNKDSWKQLALNLYVRKSKTITKFSTPCFDVKCRCETCGRFSETAGINLSPQDTLVTFQCENCGDKFAHDLKDFVKIGLASMSFDDIV